MLFDLIIKLRFKVYMIRILSHHKRKSLNLTSVLLVLGVSACATKPEPVVVAPKPVEVVEKVVEIYVPPAPAPVAVPSIDIAEYEQQLAAQRYAVLTAGDAAKPKIEEPSPVIVETLAQRLASARTADRKLAILKNEPASDDITAMITSTYIEKLAADRASGNNSGAAEALVYLGQLDAKGGSRDADMLALGKYAEALNLDPNNLEAPRLVSSIRGSLQGYSDTLHKEAVSYFVKQDFAPAVERWTKVLLIDPGNNAARNWFNQATQAMSR